MAGRLIAPETHTDLQCFNKTEKKQPCVLDVEQKVRYVLPTRGQDIFKHIQNTLHIPRAEPLWQLNESV